MSNSSALAASYETRRRGAARKRSRSSSNAARVSVWLAVRRDHGAFARRLLGREHARGDRAVGAVEELSGDEVPLRLEGLKFALRFAQAYVTGTELPQRRQHDPKAHAKVALERWTEDACGPGARVF